MRALNSLAACMKNKGDSSAASQCVGTGAPLLRPLLAGHRGLGIRRHHGRWVW